MSDLLSGFGPGESAVLLSVLEREEEARTRGEQRLRPRKPLAAELIVAGWKSPPPPPPPLAGLLRELREAAREYGPKCWTVFSPDADAVLRAFHERDPGLLRRKVTKRDGEMWGLACDPA